MTVRSLGIRHLVCGSCNGCEHEMNALASAQHDSTRHGYDVVAAPAHANVVTVTGPMTEQMREAARAVLDGVPEPKIVVAVGDCACGRGPWADAPYAGHGAVVEIGATIEVPGCPPSPEAIVAGLHEAARRL